jgi:outer membrane lipoprotein SlyB
MTATNVSRSSALGIGSAVCATLAALALAACGPHDAAEPGTLVGGAPATQGETATPAAMQAQGTPVPLVATNSTASPAPVAAPAAAPVYAPPVTVAQAPAPYPAQPGGTRYEAPASYVPGPDRQRVAESAPVVARASIGSVEGIEPIHVRPQGTGAGAVIGGVLGAVVGNQFGHGGGRAAMTGLGAVGGAVAGNNIERNQREVITGYRVRVRLDNGRTRVFERQQLAGLRVGDRVRLDASSFHRF